MRFHRLVVRDFKGIGEREPLVFPDAGVLVVEGPNEAGKSSLMEAIDLLFEYKDSSSHRRVLEAHPIGRDEAPYVELEMSSGPYRFVYAKRWARRGGAGSRGRRGETTLHVLEPAEQHYAGADAAAKAAQILDETLDRPLWDALRLMQATSLTPVPLSGSAELRAALDAAAGTGVDAGGEGESVLAAAEAEYRRYFTAATGKPTGDYDRALAALEAARHELAVAQEAVAEVESHVTRHASVSAEIEGLTARLAEARAKRDDLAERKLEGERLQARLASAEEALERARAAEHDAALEASRRTALVDEVAERADLCEQGDRRLAVLLDSLQDKERASAAAREALDLATDEADLARERLDAARALIEERGLRDELCRLRARLHRVDDLTEQIAEVRGLVAGLRTDERAGKRVEAAERALEHALVAQRAASASVVAEPLGETVSLGVDGEPVDLAEPQRWSLTDEMTIEVAGVVRVRLVPEAGAADRAAEVASARRELASVLTELGVGTPADAYEQADRRREAEQRRAQLETARAAALDGDDLGALRDRCGELDRRVSEATAHTGEAEEDRDEPSPARMAELKQMETDARRKVTDARAAADAARADAEAARLLATESEVDTTAARRELGAREKSLAAARTDVSDGVLDERRTQAAATLAVAEGERDALVKQVGDSTGQQLFDAAERAADAAASRLTCAETELSRIGAVLEELGSQGRAERLAEAATALEAAERTASGITRHAEAARMLFEALRRHSDVARAAYVAPFTTAVERLGRLVYGPTFGVSVAADLTIERRSLNGVSVPYASLSTGAKEQLAILVRLACAQLVDPPSGVPVVIDDALGYSDPDRILATSSAFEHVGEQAQVIMLTCTPGRYDGVREAASVRLGR